MRRSALRLSQHAFSPASDTHNIAARSLGRGMPLVEATAREPADAECLSAGRLGAVGAERYLLSTRSIRDRCLVALVRADQLQPETRRRPSP